jgi:adenylosuccinate synthase
MPADLQALTDCEPVYKTFKGWSGSTTGATTYKQLPMEAKRYLQYLEDLSECPIDMISTGSRRRETIILRNPLMNNPRLRGKR